MFFSDDKNTQIELKEKHNSLSIVAVCRTKFSEKGEFILVFFLNTVFTYSVYLDNTILAINYNEQETQIKII